MDVLVEFTSHPDHPVDLNITNNNGSTPAHLAALKGHVAVMRALHEGEADCNLANKKDPRINPHRIAQSSTRKSY